MKQACFHFRKSIAIIGVAVVMSITSTAQISKYPEMPADFKSDGCTFFPDRDYRDCCVEHDKAYYFGGTLKDRRAADDEFAI